MSGMGGESAARPRILPAIAAVTTLKEMSTSSAQVFLSYAAEDRERAREIAEALTSRGRVVWWDRLIPGGALWSEQIATALEQSSAVVVLWSESSVASHFVLAEARHAAHRNILVPAVIATCDPPMPFGEYQTLDLTSWDDDPDTCMEMLVAALDKVQPRAGVEGPSVLLPRDAGRSRSQNPGLTYAGDLFELVTGPKAFLLGKWNATRLGRDAAVFYVISTVLMQVLALPLSLKLGSTLPWELLGGFVYAPIRMLLLGAVVHVAWRAVGATASPKVTLSVFAYIYSLLGLLFECSQTLGVGVLRAVAPAVADDLFAGVTAGQGIEPVQQAILEHGLGLSSLFFALAAWPFLVVPLATWGAFRIGNQLTRPRSALAAALAVALGVPVYIVTVFLSYTGAGPG